MKRPFDEQFKEELSNYEEHPSDLSWVAVSSQLEALRARKIRNRLLAIATVLLLGAGGFMASFALTESEGNKQLLALEHESLNIPSLKSADAQLPEELHSGVPAVEIQHEEEPANPSVPQTTGHHENDRSSPQHAPFDRKLATLGPDPAFSGEVALPNGGPYLLEDGTIDEEAFEGFTVGLMGGVQHASLRGTTIDNYMADRQIHRMGSLRPLFGMAARFDFNSSFGLETNLIISSGEGELFNLRGESKNLSVNYIRIPLMARYRFINVGKTGKYPNAINVMAGFQYGRLNWVNLDDFGSDLQPRDFNVNEMGFAAGAAFDQYFSEDYMLTFGVRGSISNHHTVFPNVFYRNRMINYNLGAYVQLNYNIR